MTYKKNTVKKFTIAPNPIKEQKLNIFRAYPDKTVKTIDYITKKDKFEANNKIVIERTKVFEDDKNIVYTIGRLDQLHRDILDIILYYGEKLEDRKEFTNKKGIIIRLISLYKIQKKLYQKNAKNYSNEWIKAKLRQIKRTTIQILKKDGEKIISEYEFSIVEEHKFSEKLGEYGIKFTSAYMKFTENTISISYQEYLDTILKLSHQQSKALARYILTYSNSFKIKLDDLLIKLLKEDGEKITKRQFNKHRQKILEDREILEKELNIHFRKISDDKRKKDFMLEYKLLPKIKIYHPEK